MDTRTQRYRHNPNPPHERSLPGWPNVERHLFDSPEAVPEDEGWVTHPHFIKTPQIQPVAADPAPAEAEVAEEIPADGGAPKPRRGRKPKGA